MTLNDMGPTMIPMIPPWPLTLTFLVACVILAVTPGPGVLYIVTRSLVQGRSSGLASVAGVALGNLGNAVAASVGLAALFAASSLAFTIVKYIGAGYLVYLGVQMIRSRSAARSVQVEVAPLRHVFRDGFVVALFNPKTTVFFAAFLPQFLTPGSASMAQGLLLGTVFVAIAALSDSVYALAASALAPVVSSSGRLHRAGAWLGGATCIGLGIVTALASGRSK